MPRFDVATYSNEYEPIAIEGMPKFDMATYSKSSPSGMPKFDAVAYSRGNAEVRRGGVFEVEITWTEKFIYLESEMIYRG